MQFLLLLVVCAPLTIDVLLIMHEK